MFEAMYYPYASIQNIETLKQSLLYLDRIYVLTPYESTISDNINELKKIDIEFWDSKSIFKKVKESASEEIIKTIHPVETFRKYEDIFVNSVKEDLADEFFRQYEGQESWMLYEDKMPRMMFEMGFKEKIKRTGGGILQVSKDLGESVLINHTIYSCLDKKLVPLTDEIEHSRVLTHKIRRNYDRYKQFLYEEGYIEDLKQQILTKKIIEKRLSGLKGIDVTDIIDFRDDNKNELRRFRVKMGQISSKIKSEPFNPEFETEISQALKNEIDPSIEALNSSMEEFKDEMVKKYTTKAIPLTFTFSTLVAFGADLSIGILGSLLADKIHSKLSNDEKGILETILDDWKQNRSYKRNSIQYLINIETKFKNNTS